jgi:hypothetical protein
VFLSFAPIKPNNYQQFFLQFQQKPSILSIFTEKIKSPAPIGAGLWVSAADQSFSVSARSSLALSISATTQDM